MRREVLELTRIQLTEAISELRRQITAAMAEAEGQDLRFRLGGVELEFQVELNRSADAKAGIEVWVVSAGAGGKLSSAETHRVKLSLQPLTDEGGDVLVGRHREG